MQKQQVINIDPAKLPQVKCQKCGSEYLKQAFKARRVPAFMSKSGRDEMLLQGVFLCAACGLPIKADQEPQKADDAQG